MFDKNNKWRPLYLTALALLILALIVIIVLNITGPSTGQVFSGITR